MALLREENRVYVLELRQIYVTVLQCVAVRCNVMQCAADR